MSRTTQYAIRKINATIYFSGFLPGERGVSLSLGLDQAKKYDSLLVARAILANLIKVSGLSNWRLEQTVKGM